MLIFYTIGNLCCLKFSYFYHRAHWVAWWRGPCWTRTSGLIPSTSLLLYQLWGSSYPLVWASPSFAGACWAGLHRHGFPFYHDSWVVSRHLLLTYLYLPGMQLHWACPTSCYSARTSGAPALHACLGRWRALSRVARLSAWDHSPSQTFCSPWTHHAMCQHDFDELREPFHGFECLRKRCHNCHKVSP